VVLLGELKKNHRTLSWPKRHRPERTYSTSPFGSKVQRTS
jgi:hypothetical protein